MAYGRCLNCDPGKEALLLSMRLVFTQILVILLYVAVGYAAGKARLILPEQRKYLSGLA